MFVCVWDVIMTVSKGITNLIEVQKEAFIMNLLVKECNIVCLITEFNFKSLYEICLHINYPADNVPTLSSR